MEIMPVNFSAKSRWFYIFSFGGIKNKESDYERDFYVLVLMDGTVVEPEVKE